MKLNQVMKTVIDNTVAQRYEQQNTCAVWQEVMLKSDTAQRKDILRQGKADFVMGEAGLTPEQTVLLYCRHYLQMHLASSRYLFELFSKEQSTVEYPLYTDGVTMIDFGCGPMTSGLALASHIHESRQKKATINYIGIDHSPAMLEVAKVLSHSRELFSTASNFHFLQDDNIESLINILNQQKKNSQKSTIILNFSYLFASDSLDQRQLAGTINKLLNCLNGRKIVVFFQNPPMDNLNEKWFLFKQELVFNFEIIKDSTRVPYYEYQFFNKHKLDIQKPSINLYYEILKNK